jgi:DNA-binding CsgD family transcriptional regulator
MSKNILKIFSYSLLTMLIYIAPIDVNAITIKGKVNLQHNWNSKVYLSFINSFNDINTSSYDFLIHIAKIDSLGYFEINNIDIPKDNRLYRLHICKKGDPISTIIIGGKEENFVHFIMKNNDSISINNETNEFRKTIINGNIANTDLAKLLNLRNSLYAPPDVPSAQSRKFLRDQILNDFKILADTSSFDIIKPFAFYFINESFNSINKLEYINDIYSDLNKTDTSSEYYKSFMEELNYLNYQYEINEKNNFFGISIKTVLLVFLSLLFFYLYRRLKIKKNNIQNDDKLETQLSIQEKRVLELLKEGKSNKEISQELHIEVSTVKSHLNKIYSRLGVKGRKELVN